MRTYIILLLLLAGACHTVFSQSTISGTISNTKGTPLDGAHVHISQYHAVTTPDGRYELHLPVQGRQRVVASYIGYKNLDTIIDISGSTILNAVLKPEAQQLNEVVITAASAPKTTVHDQKLNTAMLERYSSQSLGDALKEIPGVTALKTGITIVKPIISGLHSSRVPVIVNNVRLEDQQWGTEHAPNIDINAAGRVQVIKGAQALQYGGDAIGGIVVIEPLSVLKDTLYGKTLLSLQSNGRGGSITSSLHKGNSEGWLWNATGTVKYLGDREAPDYTLSNTGNREGNFAGDVKYIADSYDFSASYSYYNAKIGIAKATHIGNITDLVTAINSRQPAFRDNFTYNIGAPRQEVQHHLAKLNVNKRFSASSSLALQYAFQQNLRQEYDIRRGSYTDTPALDLTLNTHTLQADWKKEAGDFNIKSGAIASLQKNTASPETGIRPLIPDYDRLDLGAYGTVSYPLSERFIAEAGARYDFSHMDAVKFYQKSRWNNLGYNGRFDNFITADYGSQWLTKPEYTFHNISASLGIRKVLNNGYEIFANAGLLMRNPNPSELFSDGLHHSNGTIELGSLALDKEKAVKASVSLLKTRGSFTFEATPYINAINNFMYLSPGSIEYTIRGAFPVYNYLQTNALLTGIDLQTVWQINTGFRHTLGAAYVHGTDVSENRPLIDMPPFNITNTLRYTKQQWQDLFLELRSEFTARQTRYPNNNFTVNVPQNGEQVPVLVNVSSPPPAWHLLHFNSGVSFSTSSKSSLAVNFSVQNIFNTSYRDYLNRQRLYTDDTGRNFMLQLKYNY